jgi:hypothetical protein
MPEDRNRHICFRQASVPFSSVTRPTGREKRLHNGPTCGLRHTTASLVCELQLKNRWLIFYEGQALHRFGSYQNPMARIGRRRGGNTPQPEGNRRLTHTRVPRTPQRENEMTLHRKPYIENRKKIAEQKLSHRLDALKAQGLGDSDIQKDAAIRQIKAAIRHAKRQMAWIADLEAKDQKKAVVREEKRNAPKEARPKVKKAQQGESQRKAKREKKQSMQG